jgi:hypothetical protein
LGNNFYICVNMGMDYKDIKRVELITSTEFDFYKRYSTNKKGVFITDVIDGYTYITYKNSNIEIQLSRRGMTVYIK